MIREVYPRVYKSGCSQTVYVKLQAEVVEPVAVRIFGMERYTVPHTARYRIDEYDRHPFRQMKNLGGGLYSLTYEFPYEQRYRLRFRIGETVLDAAEELLEAIKGERAVAVNRRSDTDFFVFGSFRLVKYARFLLDCYFPGYQRLTPRHGQALAASAGSTPVAELAKTEGWLREYREKFFASHS